MRLYLKNISKLIIQSYSDVTCANKCSIIKYTKKQITKDYLLK